MNRVLQVVGAIIIVASAIVVAGSLGTAAGGADIPFKMKFYAIFTSMMGPVFNGMVLVGLGSILTYLKKLSGEGECTCHAHEKASESVTVSEELDSQKSEEQEKEETEESAPSDHAQDGE